MSDESTISAALERAALQSTARNPAFLGYWLERHRVSESLSSDDLAARLGTNPAGLALLALCHAPRSAEFAEDVAVAAKRAGVHAASLAKLLRQEQSLESWSTGNTGSLIVAESGWLLAAHDAEQPPPGPADDPPLA